ncbi:hypothetical protein [Streptomyces asoensis]|uniref:Uncharacterized protein n=1 Tax=Streptomyces asoensis TaxID=249586 RepID=A0ABQ3S417_9ACTN|nr:hypothetical protein [Streptomyces asoensis]GGQ81935.1 hypothetical protein GCM10010496_51910 [Streptomyces asoensis]GHI62752.1 hypothetical protein Saso_44020 [Streptomyces asoensis]
MRFRNSASAAASADLNKGRTSDDLRREYDLITRERDGGHNALSAINAQNDIARELERRGR